MPSPRNLSVYLILLLIVFFFARRCGRKSVDRPKILPTFEYVESKPDTVVNVRTDVQYVTVTKTDTVYQTKVVYLTAEPAAPAEWLEPDTVYVYTGANADKDSISLFTGIVEDSAVTLKYRASIKGTLKKMDVGYLLKQPKTITVEKIKTVKETETVTITKEKVKGGIFLGAGMAITPEPSLDLTATLNAAIQTRKGLQIGYAFAPFQKRHNVSIMKRLTWKRGQR